MPRKYSSAARVAAFAARQTSIAARLSALTAARCDKESGELASVRPPCRRRSGRNTLRRTRRDFQIIVTGGRSHDMERIAKATAPRRISVAEARLRVQEPLVHSMFWRGILSIDHLPVQIQSSKEQDFERAPESIVQQPRQTGSFHRQDRRQRESEPPGRCPQISPSIHKKTLLDGK